MLYCIRVSVYLVECVNIKRSELPVILKEEIMRIITCSQHVIPLSPDLSHFVPINIINWYKLSTLYNLSYIELN